MCLVSPVDGTEISKGVFFPENSYPPSEIDDVSFPSQMFGESYVPSLKLT